MTHALILGSLLGLFSGMVPGPFTALIAATALKGGFWSAFRIGVVPLVTETLVMGVTALVLSQLPGTVLRWMGLVGGLFIFYLAVRIWRDADGSEPTTGDKGPASEERVPKNARDVFEGGVLAVLSPTPWVFWLLVGGPLFLASWRDSWAAGLAFLGSFLLFLVGAYLAVAGLAAYGQKHLSGAWRVRLMRTTSGALVIAGTVLLWQSYEGNFQRMVTGSETIETLVTDSILGGR